MPPVKDPVKNPGKKAPGWARWTLLMASLGWLLLTVASYLSLPMF
ncbi:hypothetical protein ACFYSC_34500 [Streptosporangium sp. NPDC004379]